MKITRRFFLRTSGALAAYCGLSPVRALGEETLQAAAASEPVRRGRTLVAIFLRGGMDGLNFAIPHGDRNYYDLRKSIAIGRPGGPGGALDLDGFFGLHPAAESLVPLVKSGEAALLHAVGYSKNTRSHFEEQDVWETGVIGNTLGSDGWLNRHLLTSEGHGPIRAIAIGNTLPRILHGNAPAFAVRGIADLALPRTKAPGEAVAAALEHAYATPSASDRAEAMDLLARTAGNTLEAVALLKDVAKQTYKPAAEYPKSGIADQLREAARLIKAGIGVEVVEIDYGGWDTHSAQGNQGGSFANLVRGLSEALAAFRKDLGDGMEDVLVLTLSDFGRTAAENGTGGTDHGWGNCMLALGGPVLRAGAGKARQVLGKWPGLGADVLHERRDLLHTTDFRDVLGEVVRVHLGNPNLERVLPSHTFAPVNLVG
jgi:uncharacterized protein (DUF1501 family)